MKIPKTVEVGNRTVKVKMVDFDSDSYVWDNNDFLIQVNKKATPELQQERFWHDLLSVTFDYVNLLEEIEKEVGEADVPDFSRANFGEVFAKVIADNKL